MGKNGILASFHVAGVLCRSRNIARPTLAARSLQQEDENHGIQSTKRLSCESMSEEEVVDSISFRGLQSTQGQTLNDRQEAAGSLYPSVFWINVS